MKDIHILFDEAALLHGHRCPGLAIGVRAATIAAQHFGEGHSLSCVVEQKACFLDGIQSVSGATIGNGRLHIRLTGKAVFSFYDDAAGDSLRLYFKGVPRSGDKAQQIESVLTAPEDELFCRGKAHGEKPAYVPKGDALPCESCGELTDKAMLASRGGRLVCRDCAELL